MPITNAKRDADLAARIRQEFVAFRGAIQAAIAVPEGHHWRKPSSELTWFGGDVIQSTLHGASIFLDRRDLECPGDLEKIDQIHVEIRWFWGAADDTRKALKAGREKVRAILWCQYGPRIGFTSKDMLLDGEQFASCDSISGLAGVVSARINAALARCPRAQARQAA